MYNRSKITMTPLSNKKLTKNQQIILYLTEKLKGSIGGRKKIVKLMFLYEYYDFQNNKIVETPKFNTQNEFYIYHYGVFNSDILIETVELIKRGYIEDGYPLKISNKGKEYNLADVNAKDELDQLGKVISKFGKKYNGFELELVTLAMLGLGLSTKGQYKNKTIKEVKEIISNSENKEMKI